MKLSTMKWLIKRELWEHKGGFIRGPIIAAAVICLLMVGTIGWLATNGISRLKVVEGNPTSVAITFSELAANADMTQRLGKELAKSYLSATLPLVGLFALVAFFYCLNGLFDERKDRSVLFWKSMPVTDTDTVISKAVVALLVAPVIAWAVAVVSSVIIVLVGGTIGALAGWNMLGAILSATAFYLTPLQIAAILPVYVLWALPAVGWLLMVGAWAKSKPILWAVGLPLFVGAVLSWFNYAMKLNWDLKWYWGDTVGRGLLSIVPGTWMALNPLQPLSPQYPLPSSAADFLARAWEQLAVPNIWIGAVAGILMIAVAIRLRRWRDEG